MGNKKPRSKVPKGIKPGIKSDFALKEILKFKKSALNEIKRFKNLTVKEIASIMTDRALSIEQDKDRFEKEVMRLRTEIKLFIKGIKISTLGN